MSRLAVNGFVMISEGGSRSGGGAASSDVTKIVLRLGYHDCNMDTTSAALMCGAVTSAITRCTGAW